MEDPLERTIVTAADFGFSPRIHFSEPQLQWTDASGSHSYLLDRRRVIGSAADVDVVVNAPEVSRLHAAVELEEDGVWVRDLGSRNGTYVEGVRVLAARVPDGGTIHVGTADLRLFYNQNLSEVVLWPRDQFGQLVGRSTVMRELFARLFRIADLDSTVLIQGETGTGKELVARAIHNHSRRCEGPFVVVDCGALPESLLEAELFGHARGAYTGAAGARAGAIESAEGGTLFLDEIGEMPLSMQPKLLRAIEGHMVRRIGETAYREVNVRFLAATNRDLAEMVNRGEFREDLYFRLAVLPVTVPPLRAHLEDIPLLAERLLPAGARGAVSPELLRELCGRSWPGNVRELRNFLERAVALGVREALALAQGPASGRPRSTASESFPAVSIAESFKEVRDRWVGHLEREYLRLMIAKHGRDTGSIAQASGLDRSYIYRLIRKHEL